MSAVRSLETAVASETTAHEPEWQRLWFTLQGRQASQGSQGTQTSPASPWSSLAVIGSDAGADAERVARTLAAIGRRDGQTPVEVITALGVTFQDVPRIVGQLSHPGPDRLLVSCDPLQRNPAMIPILHAVDGVVLVVRLGESRLDAVQKTVDAIGRDKIVATISIG